MTVETKEKVVAGTSIEFVTLDGDSSVNSWNGISAVSISEEAGSILRVTYELPSDMSASAALFALIGGANLGTIYSHRNDDEGNVYLTIRHNIDRVLFWEIKSDLQSAKVLVSIEYGTESSILIGDQEVTTLD